MKVVLSAINVEKNVVPLAGLHLKNYAETAKDLAGRVQIEVLNFQVKDSLEAICQKLLACHARVYGFSIYVWNATLAIALAQKIKLAAPDSIIIFGGPEASGLCETWIQTFSDIDLIVKGEGEIPFVKILAALDQNKPLTDIPGLCFRTEGRVIVSTAPERVEDLAQIPSPILNDYHNLVLRRHYTNIVHWETSRGCPFLCKFCGWGAGQKVRFFPYERVEKELRYLLLKRNVCQVYVVDANFFANKARAKKLLEIILERNYHQIPFYFELEGGFLDEEIIALITQMPIQCFSFGIQSTDPQVLEIINRRFNFENFKANIAQIRALLPSATIWFDLIEGLPGDNLTTFRKSLDYALSLEPSFIQIHRFHCIPGSTFHQEHEKYQLVFEADPPHRIISTPTFSIADLQKAHELSFYTSVCLAIEPIRQGLFSLWKTRPDFPDNSILAIFEDFWQSARGQFDFTQGRDLKGLENHEFPDAGFQLNVDKTKTPLFQRLIQEYQATFQKLSSGHIQEA